MNDNDRVRQAMIALSEAAQQQPTPLPDPYRIWVEAQLWKRQVRQQRALLPVRVTGALAAGVLVVAATRIPALALASVAQGVPLPAVAAMSWALLAIPLVMVLAPALQD